MGTNRRPDRQLYQGQVRCLLEQTGDLGMQGNPYALRSEGGTEKPKRSKSSSGEPPWVHPQVLVVPLAVKEAWAAALQRP